MPYLFAKTECDEGIMAKAKDLLLAEMDKNFFERRIFLDDEDVRPFIETYQKLKDFTLSDSFSSLQEHQRISTLNNIKTIEEVLFFAYWRLAVQDRIYFYIEKTNESIDSYFGVIMETTANAAFKFDLNRASVKFSTYLFQALRNQIMRIAYPISLQKKFEQSHLTVGDRGFGEKVAPTQSNPVNFEERLKKLFLKLSAILSPRQLMVLKLYYMDELTLQEIGKMQNVTKQRIDDILKRTRKKIQQSLDILEDED